MRIGAILPHLQIFGGVRRYIELGNAFVSRDHEFLIYTPESAPAEWLEFKGSVRALGELTDRDHDILMCGSPELLNYMDDARAKAKIFYLQIEGVAGEMSIIRSGRYRIMVNSSGLARRVRKRYFVKALEGIGGINPALFHRPGRERADGAPFRILCYGRLSRPRKGTRFVVSAARKMYRRGFDVELNLFDTVEECSEDPRIGFRPDLPFRYYLNLSQSGMSSMYGAADVFVSAEHRAGWSNTAAEAAACGLPLVCTRSGTRDFAVQGESALLLPLRSPLFIGRALERLYRDRELARRLGSGAVRRIGEFTWDRVCARMERTFREITGGIG